MQNRCIVSLGQTFLEKEIEMKPFVRVLWNTVKYNLIRILKCRNLRMNGILLLGYNTRLSVCRTSRVIFGKHVVSDGRCVIIADRGANVEIGDSVYFNEGMMISSKESVTIGSGCQFGPNVKIFDNNHCFDKEHGVLSSHDTRKITIGSHCWIAANVTILQGTMIGDRCVIGAGCVVKGNVPTASVVTQDSKVRIIPMEDKKR